MSGPLMKATPFHSRFMTTKPNERSSSNVTAKKASSDGLTPFEKPKDLNGITILRALFAEKALAYFVKDTIAGCVDPYEFYIERL